MSAQGIVTQQSRAMIVTHYEIETHYKITTQQELLSVAFVIRNLPLVDTHFHV